MFPPIPIQISMVPTFPEHLLLEDNADRDVAWQSDFVDRIVHAVEQAEIRTVGDNQIPTGRLRKGARVRSTNLRQAIGAGFTK